MLMRAARLQVIQSLALLPRQAACPLCGRPQRVRQKKALVKLLSWRAAPCRSGHSVSEMSDGWIYCQKCFRLWSPTE